MIKSRQAQGLNPLPLFAASLKEAETAAIIADLLTRAGVSVILNATSFAVSIWQQPAMPPFRCVRLVRLARLMRQFCKLSLRPTGRRTGEQSSAGLTARDLAMNVALPELDGRVLARAIGFKRPLVKDPLTHAMTTGFDPLPERVDYVASLAAAWARLRATPPAAKKKLGLILANYPNRDGRIANGVGLDTPQSVYEVLHLLAAEGYELGHLPDSSADLINALRAGPTNAGWQGRESTVFLSLANYQAAFATLPDALREDITERWGAASADPMFDGSDFRLPILTYGNVAVGVQPARGYNIDPKATYHDLVPPHNYLAFYIWLRQQWQKPCSGAFR